MSKEDFYSRDPSELDVVPETAKSFVKSLQRALKMSSSKAKEANPLLSDKQIGKAKHDLAQLYDQEFNKLTERYFKSSAWPTAEAITALVEDDAHVLILYKDLYFRHIYAKMTPTVDDRFDSFQNYVDLFNFLLGFNSESPDFDLPTTWCWDILDEFIYQFQTFHLFRSRCKDLSPEEVALLKEHEHMWSAQTVIQYLHALVRKAGIDLTKKSSEASDEENNVAPMFKTLGNFALVGLLRVNCLLCDYSSALSVLNPIDLRRDRVFFTQVLSCHTTLYYYMGFAYFMTRRYIDAIKIFCYFLSYIQRNKHLLQKNWQSSVILKKVEQMLGVLGMAYALSSSSGLDSGAMGMDENIANDVRDKLDEKLTRMQKGDVSAYEEVFAASCPKFLTVSTPNYDAATNTHTDALQLQIKIFTSEVRQRAHIPEVYSYLKLFTTLSISKLAVFLQYDEEYLTSLLLKIGHKTRTQRWVGGPPADGTWQQNSEVNFTVQKDMIHVTEQKSVRRYGDFFMRQINRLAELTSDIKNMKVQAQRR